MKNEELNSAEIRICKICQQPLTDDDHGNRKAHKSCAYRNKKQRQKVKYKIGNSAKLLIQKNEAVAASLYLLDKERCGIPHIVALEYGLKFTCPTTTFRHLHKEIHMFEHYGYSIDTVDGEDLIFIHYETEF